MADWMPKSARPYRPASAKPDVTGAESAARGAYQGAGMGFADEQAGALDALGGHLKRTFTNGWKRTGGGWVDDIKAEFGQVTDDYQRGRDESRQAYAEAQEANPVAYGTGQFGGAVATGLMTGGASALGRAGLKGALTAGALEGAAGGVGSSEADLTKQDVDAYARTFRDSLEGAAKGAAFGGVGYGVGKGLKWIGGKALGALRNARGELTEGISAERQVADDAARAAEEKAQGRLVKDEYAARQQNGRMDSAARRQSAVAEAKRARADARAEREAQRAQSQQQKEFRAANERTQVDKRYADPSAKPPLRLVPPRAGAPEVLEEPGTKTLNNYVGGAWSSRELNVERVAAARARLADPNIPAGQRAADLAYVERHAQAVEAPHEFVRGKMRAGLRRDQYPSDMVDRIMAERIDPQGNVLSRSAPEAMAENPALLRQRERGFGAQNMGAARYGDETIAYPNADIRRAQAPSGDPFHDAPTKVGLVRSTPPEGDKVFGRDAPVHRFEFRDPKSGRPYFAKASIDPEDAENIHLDYVGPADVDPRQAMMNGYGGEKNAVGPGVMKQVMGELARAFPGAKRLSAWRITGANADRDLVMNLPEVTQAQPRAAIRGANPPGEFERAIASRNGEMLPASGRRAAKAWETAPQTQVEGLPEIPRGMRRLYRGEASGGNPQTPAHYPPGSLNAEDINSADGRWFTDRAGVARDYALRAAERSGGTPAGKYLDVPQGEARQYRGDAVPEGRFADEAFREWLPPRAAVRDAKGMDIPRDVPLGADEGMPAYAPFWERGIGDDVWPNRAPEEVGAGDITQRINFDGEATQTGRGGPPPAAPRTRPAQQMAPTPREAPVSMDDLRDWTGTPETPRAAPESFPEMEDLTQPGRPAFPGDARTAAPFAQRPSLRQGYQPRSAQPVEPTQNIRAPQRAPVPQRPALAYDPEASMNAPRDFDAETAVPLGDTQVPRAPRAAPYASPTAPELAPEPMQVQPLRQAVPRPLAPPVTPPAQTTMDAPPGSLVRQARPSAEEMAGQQEAGALGGLVRAGWEGARRANNALAAPFGAAYGIGKEAMENPAVRARAISLFRLDRLARVRPEVWARVGPTLQRAMQAGPERFKAERHVLLLRDPEFRAAEAEADAELERMDGQLPTRRAAGAR